MRGSPVDRATVRNRCCRRTIERDDGPDIEERKLVCRCRTPLVFRDGAWRWDKGVEILPSGVEIVR